MHGHVIMRHVGGVVPPRATQRHKGSDSPNDL